MSDLFNSADRQYLDLVQRIMDHGTSAPDRTGVGTLSVFGHQMRFDLREGFPLITAKRTFWKGAFVELLWMLRGRTDLAWLHQYGVTIWDEWACDDGHLGPVYGAQWRQWHTSDGRVIDQIAELIMGLRHRPYSRRHILTAWNPADLPDDRDLPQVNAQEGRMALAPCHMTAQFYYRDGKLSCQVYQRSCDVFLGLPFNLAGYALLTLLLARRLGYRPGELVWTGGDCHLYTNHLTLADRMRERDPTPLPSLIMQHEPSRPLDQIEPEELHIVGYAPHPAIPAPVAV